MPPDPGSPKPESGPGLEDDPDGTNPPLDLWSWLPRLSLRRIRGEQRLARWAETRAFRDWIGWIESRLNVPLVIGPPEVVDRISGLKRPGLIAQFRAPAWKTRLAVGLDVPLAHAVVDGLLAYNRPLGESRLQLSPVEWGVWSYLAVLGLATIDRHSEGETRHQPRGFGLLLDRLGPDPFDPTALGSMVTVLWPVQVGATSGTARLWISESALALLGSSEPQGDAAQGGLPGAKVGQFCSLWHAEAGTVNMPLGLRRLRAGGVLPLSDCRLAGTPQSLTGSLNLVCELTGAEGKILLPAEPVTGSSGRLVRLTDHPRHEHAPRQPLTLGINNTMPSTDDHAGKAENNATLAPGLMPTDIPVTLTVELGRLSVTLSRLADLRPGDVLELGRHSREPVELTSNGRLVARGELVLIDTELGVRVTHVFL